MKPSEDLLNFVDNLTETVYDPLREAKRIKDNIDVALLPGTCRLTVSLRDPFLFDEVLLLLSRDGFANAESGVSVVRRLDCDRCTETVIIDENRFVTACVGDVYVPVYHLE